LTPEYIRHPLSHALPTFYKFKTGILPKTQQPGKLAQGVLLTSLKTLTTSIIYHRFSLIANDLLHFSVVFLKYLSLFVKKQKKNGTFD
jgi:hypothetical protein